MTGILPAEPKRRHGRRERRVLWAVSQPGVLGWLGSTGPHQTPWPPVHQICRLERHRLPVRRGVPTGSASVETTSSITSLPPERADAARLLTLIRGHGGIENRLHSVRDVTFDDDRSSVRSGAAPLVMAASRNVVLARLRRQRHTHIRQRHTHIAAALRTYPGRPDAAIQLVANPHRLMVN
jgi:hypothetical protein